MANQIPLIVNAGAAQIQELATADNLEISANIVAGGILTDGYYYANGTPVTFGGGNVDLTAVTTDIIPVGNNTQSLGNATNQWQDIYVSNATIYFDSVPLTVDGSGALTFDGNSLVQTGPNVVNTGTLETTGNIIGANVEANFFFGDGSNLTGIASGVSVSQWATGNALSNTIANVENIWFDSTTGFNVTNITGNTALISLGSSFKTWEVAGQANLVAVGEDTVEFVAGNNIVITTNANVIPQQIEFAVSSDIAATSISVTGNITANALAVTDFYSPNFYSNAVTYANATGYLSSTNLFKYNPSTEVLSVGSASLTGNVDLSGNINFVNNTAIQQSSFDPSPGRTIETITLYANVQNDATLLYLEDTGNANLRAWQDINLNTYTQTRNNNWKFDASGDLTVPGNIIGGNANGILISSDGNVTLSSKGAEFVFDAPAGNLYLPKPNGAIVFPDDTLQNTAYTGILPAAGNVGDIQINVGGNIGADSSLRYVDDGGEMTLYADYFNTSTVFTNDILGSGNAITISAQFGNTVTFDTTGGIAAPGNVTADIFNLADAGNLTYSSIQQNQNPPYGSEAYGIEMLTTTDDANVFSSVSAGPDYVSLKSTNAGNANVVVQGGYGVTISTSNATGGSIKEWTFTAGGNALFPGALSTALDISTTGNANVQGIVSAVGNIITDGYFVGNFAGNITGNIVIPGANTQVIFNTNGNADATGGMTFDKGPNLFTILGTISAQGNVISGNVLTSNIVSAGGNVTGNYFIGNGSALTGIVSTYSNTNVQSYLEVLTSNISTTGNIQAGGNVTAGNFSTAGNILGAGNFSVTGNAQAGNFSTAGNILGTGNFSVTGNAIAGNFTTAGNVSAGGNIILGNAALQSFGANYVLTANSQNYDTAVSMTDGGGVNLISANVGVQVTSGTDVWTFNTDGSLTFPDASTQTTAYTGGGGNTDWANIGNINNANGPSQISIGTNAGNSGQSGNTIAIGVDAGANTQGVYSVAVGALAGQSNQLGYGVAIGLQAGQSTQGIGAIAIGGQAGGADQGGHAVAIGQGAGLTSQGNSAVAIGFSAGYNLQGSNSIAIGTNAGFGITTNAQANNTIILNATGNELNGVSGQANSFYVAPVRNDTGNTANALYYNTSTFEISYGPAASGTSNSIVNGTSNVTIPTANSNVTINANASAWLFGTDGTTQFPANTINTAGQLSIKSFDSLLDIQSANTTVGSGGEILLNSGFTGPTSAGVTIAAYVDGTLPALKEWVFDAEGNLTLPSTNVGTPTAAGTPGESQLLFGTRKAVNGVYSGATNPFAVELAPGPTSTVVYTATNSNVQSVKVTFAVQSTGNGYCWEQFDVVATPSQDNIGTVNYVVSNRVKSLAIITETQVTATINGSGQIEISLTPMSGQNGWASFDAIEFGLMVD